MNHALDRDPWEVAFSDGQVSGIDAALAGLVRHRLGLDWSILLDQPALDPGADEHTRGYRAGWLDALRDEGFEVEEYEDDDEAEPVPLVEVEQRRGWGLRLEPDEIAELLDAGAVIDCNDCGKQISPGGPTRIWVRETGEIGQAFCGRCVVRFAKRRKAEAR